jgi:hypothetical protein
LLAITIGGTRSADGQAPAPTAVFLEKAYFSPITPWGKNLLFEGQPTAHYFFFNQFSDERWQRSGGWRFAASVSELFVVRMPDTVSSPVLTPSYHIRPLYLQAVQLRRRDSMSVKFQLTGLSTGFVHYSNGQHRCTYLGYARDATSTERVCRPVDAALASQLRTNTIDGDFSTSYFPIAFHHRWATLIEPYSYVKWQVTSGFEFQLHPYGGGIRGAPDREQTIRFGQHQASAFFEWECRPKRKSGVWRIGADYTERFGGGVDHRLRRGSVQGSYVFDKHHHLA